MRRYTSGPGGSHVGLFGRQLMLREGEGEGSGGAGGEKPLTAEAIVALVNKTVHAAAGERDKRIMKEVGKLFSDGMKTFSEGLPELLKASGFVPTPEKPEGTGDDKGASKISPEMEARFAKMERETKLAQEKAAKLEKERDEERTQRTRAEERTTLQQELTGKVKPAVLGIVTSQLHQSNIVRDPESNAILWKNEDGTHVPLKDGITAWVKSDVGKEFAPPVAAGGSGRGGAGGTGNLPAGAPTAEDVASMLFGNRP